MRLTFCRGGLHRRFRVGASLRRIHFPCLVQLREPTDRREKRLPDFTQTFSKKDVWLQSHGQHWPEACQAASGPGLSFFPACFFDLGLFGVLFLRYLRKGKSEQKVGRSVPAAVAPRSFRRLAVSLAILRSRVLRTLHPRQGRASRITDCFFMVLFGENVCRS